MHTELKGIKPKTATDFCKVYTRLEGVSITAGDNRVEVDTSATTLPKSKQRDPPQVGLKLDSTSQI